MCLAKNLTPRHATRVPRSLGTQHSERSGLISSGAVCSWAVPAAGPRRGVTRGEVGAGGAPPRADLRASLELTSSAPARRRWWRARRERQLGAPICTDESIEGAEWAREEGREAGREWRVGIRERGMRGDASFPDAGRAMGLVPRGVLGGAYDGARSDRSLRGESGVEALLRARRQEEIDRRKRGQVLEMGAQHQRRQLTTTSPCRLAGDRQPRSTSADGR